MTIQTIKYLNKYLFDLVTDINEEDEDEYKNENENYDDNELWKVCEWLEGEWWWW